MLTGISDITKWCYSQNFEVYYDYHDAICNKLYVNGSIFEGLVGENVLKCVECGATYLISTTNNVSTPPAIIISV